MTPLRPSFAAEIEGVRLTEELDETTVAAISAAIDEFAVVIFHGQRLDDEQQLAFGKRLGRPQTAQRTRRDAKHRLQLGELSDISNLDEHERVFAPDDRRRMRSLGNRLWHTDASFLPNRGEYSILSARHVPPAGGDTEYADLRAAYDALPDELRSKLWGLKAEHSHTHSRSQLGFTDFPPDELPPVEQPIAAIHPGSKRATLYLAAHASHVVGMPIPEGRILLHDLIEFATRREFVYTHNWRNDDVVVWDNRCTMHRGRAFDGSQVRDLRRVTTLEALATGIRA